MDFDKIIDSDCENTTLTTTTSTTSTTSTTTLPPEQTYLILRPEYSLKEPGHVVQYSAFAVLGSQEMDVSNDTVFSIVNSLVATINSSTGHCIAVAPGITTVTASWGGLTATAQIEVVQDCADIVFTYLLMFDLSTSSGLAYGGPYATRLAAAKHAGIALVNQIDFSRDSVAIGYFSFTNTTVITPATDAADAIAQITALAQTTQVTDIGDGLTKAVAHFAGNNQHKIIVLLSDGENKTGVGPVAAVATFKSQGGIVIGYGLRASIGVPLLRLIADGGYYMNSYPINLVPNGAEAVMLGTLANICAVCESADTGDCEDNVGTGYDCGCSPDVQQVDPNPLPDPEEFPPKYRSTQSYTAYCPEGVEGGPLTRTASYVSVISQADADAQAFNLAKAQAEADIICGTVDLDGSRWEMPCLRNAESNLCSCADPSDVVSILAGNPMTEYAVELRIRGVVELKTYIGGTSDGQFFHTGGTPEANGYNVYELTIDNPPQTYYLNAAWGAPGGINYVYPMDYTVTVAANGGAKFTLKAMSIDYIQLTNKGGITIPGVTPGGNNGQFIQVDVISIT